MLNLIVNINLLMQAFYCVAIVFSGWRIGKTVSNYRRGEVETKEILENLYPSLMTVGAITFGVGSVYDSQQ